MLVTDCPRLWRQTVINIKRKRFLDLVTRHRLLNFQISNSKFKIPPEQIQNSVGEWLADPGCFPKGSNADLQTASGSGFTSRAGAKATRLLLATFSNRCVSG